jgi:hypothetical protein
MDNTEDNPKKEEDSLRKAFISFGIVAGAVFAVFLTIMIIVGLVRARNKRNYDKYRTQQWWAADDWLNRRNQTYKY